MLSILYPEIIKWLKDLDYGLMPIHLPKENKYVLIIKATKEIILTAKVNNEFGLYVLNDPDQPSKCLGLISAFFDDHDEPLTLTTPLSTKNESLIDFFLQDNFAVYFFDENNFEWLGAKAAISDLNRFKNDLDKRHFANFNPDKILDIWKKMNHQFGTRTEKDDDASYKIKIGERLYPDDHLIMDVSEVFSGFNDSKRSISMSSLRRGREVGPMQEKGIAKFFRRLFESNEIFVNLIRADDIKQEKRELVDVLIINEKVMLFVQAKDSPNTEDMLNRSIDRKRNTIRNHIRKATDQLRGALSYARDNDCITVFVDDKPTEIKRNGRQIVGLIVVNELFDDDYPKCSAPVLELVKKLNLPIILLDYSQLHILTLNHPDPTSLIKGLYAILDMGLEHEQFPKPYFSKKSLNQK